jgi:hypothetical protein
MNPKTVGAEFGRGGAAGRLSVNRIRLAQRLHDAFEV